MKKRYYFILIIILIVLIVSQLKITKTISTTIKLKNYWQDNYTMVPPAATENVDFNFRLIDKAIKDECFFYVGSPANHYSYHQINCDSCREQGGRPKANQSYIWSMAEADGRLFYGTASNYLCQAMVYYQRYDSISNDCQVCEWGASTVGMGLTGNDFYGDFRPPKILVYDPANDSLIDITPYDDENLQKTLGIRVGGECNSLVMVAGPGMGEGAGELKNVILYVFDASTLNYLGSFQLDKYLADEYGLMPDNVRRCVNVDDKLYIGLKAKDLNDQDNEVGVVLRWDGNPDDIFNFTLVGKFPYPASDLCLHNNRIYIQSWPVIDKASLDSGDPKIKRPSALVMGPPMPPEGLSEMHISSWQKVWDYSSYEPDSLTSLGYMGGSMASFDGYLYFGTFHIPMANMHMLRLYNNDASRLDMMNALLATHRAICVFRCPDFDTEVPEIDIMFGMEELPVYNHDNKRWEIAANKLGKKPLMGKMGIWSPFNHYTWAMEVHQGKLFIGTKSFFRAVPPIVSAMGSRISGYINKMIRRTDLDESDFVKVDSLNCPREWLGGDLFMISPRDDQAIPITTTGFGNSFNYGIRTLISIDDHLYVGTANPYNLAKEGGYELIQLPVP